jgi:hypothetical protein
MVPERGGEIPTPRGHATLQGVKTSRSAESTLPADPYDIPIVDADGKERTLGEYRGDVLLIVNTASY